MIAQYTAHRYWLNLKRHRISFSLATLVLTAGIALICLIYPGPDALKAFINVPVFQLITGINNVATAGALIWLLIFFGSIVLTIFYPLIGIFFGVNILPFNEKEGKELILSTNKSLIWYFVENLLIVIVMIPLSVLPAYLTGAGFLLSSGGEVDLSALTIAAILPMFFVFVVTMITSLGSAIWSSPKSGYAFGGVFFIVSFTLNLLQQEIDFVKDINLMSQINSFQHAIAGTWNEEFIFKCLVLSLLLSIMTIVFLYRVDHIAPRLSYNRGDKEEDTLGIMAKFSFIRTPVESVLSRVGWKYPAFRDQLQSSAGFFLIYLLVTSILLVVVAIAYPGDALMADLLSTMVSELITSPVFAAFLFGHADAVTPTLGGFVIMKLFIFHWIYYGPFLFIATYNIIMRDRNAGYDEITWSMPRTRAQVITQRTIATLLYLWIITVFNFIALYSGEMVLGFFVDVALTDLVTTISAFIYLAIGYSIFLVL
ncbi:MAG: hypothetical protein ACFFE8_05035, partial [Candidatus Heimdallarchaeota archaeon]